MDQDETLNLPAAARLVGVTTSAVRYWIITGLLKADYVRGHWVIRKDDVLQANSLAQTNPRAGARGKRGKYVKEDATATC